MLSEYLENTYYRTQQLSFYNLKQFIPYNSDRYNHIIGVINLAKEIEKKINFNGHLVQAALYHDVGYSKHLQYTNFHPVDSALKAESDNIEFDVINAILTHTGAYEEVKLRRTDLLVFYKNINVESKLSKFLTYCDTHINSKGKKVNLLERLKDIYSRYNQNDYVYKNIKQNEKYFKKIEEYVGRMLKQAVL